jgi:signal transduction histidine kinase
VDVAELVATSVEAWRAVAAAQGATISLDHVAGTLPVAGERLRLAQVVGNLLANAIEHGGGAVEVRLRGAAGTVRIEVADDGPGLPAPIGRLIRGAGRRGRAGRGHGLGIASRVAAAHGGGLMTAPVDRGTRIVLKLPALSGTGRLAPSLDVEGFLAS